MYQEDIKEILLYKEYLLFYEVMKYPIPKYWQYFLCEKKYNWKINFPSDISRDRQNPLLGEYTKYIQKYNWIYKSIPFIQSIYLCNSITFNKLKSDSDIDLFIITKKKSLRRARFRSVLLFFIFWLKRSLSKKSKKFCLTFYITEDSQNLYDISLPQTDIYLIYWLAHLVPLYHNHHPNKSIYEYNTRIHTLLPNHPLRHCIHIWTNIFYWSTKFKTFIEKRSWWIIGNLVEYLIKTLRLPIVIFKTKKLKDAWWGIIINNTMLKFHLDKRKKISLLYKTLKNKFSSNENKW